MTQGDGRVIAPRCTATTHGAIAEIEAEGWDLCAGSADPLLWHRHLSALEDSGVAAPGNGFTPRHVVLRDADDRIVGAAPAYLKTHSRGELGVDIGLMMAHQRQSGAYFPKLQVEVPMIPFAGPRLLVRPDVDRAEVTAALAAALVDEARRAGASSVQVAQIASQAEAEALAAQGFVLAESNTYRWRPGTDRTYEDILMRMIASRRTEIRRERRRVAETGLTFHVLRDQTVPPDLSRRFYPLYTENFVRHGNEPWLPERYFAEVMRQMPEAIEIGLALQGEHWAGVLFGMGGSTGRHVMYWGQGEAIRFLHFELVYYREIERALVTGLDWLDFAGIGAHKALKGLQMEPVWTAFWFRAPEFAAVAAAAAQSKTAAAIAERAQMQALSPFRPAPVPDVPSSSTKG
jgi:predicted N-acyltransferase